MATAVFTIGDADPGSSIPLSGGISGYKMVVKTITLDGGDFASGGISLTAAQLGLSSVLWLQAASQVLGLVHQYDYTNSKLVTYRGGANNAALTDAGSGTATASTNGHVIRVVAIGAA